MVSGGGACARAASGVSRSTHVDQHVGQRLRLRRLILGFTQEQIASRVQISKQQLQQYEHGTRRTGAAVLYALSIVLDVPTGWFFEGLVGLERQHPTADEDTGHQSGRQRAGVKTVFEDAVEAVLPPGSDARAKKGLRDLIQSFAAVPPGDARRAILDLVKRLADESG